MATRWFCSAPVKCCAWIRLVHCRDTGHWWVFDYKSAAQSQRQSALRDPLGSYRDAVQQQYPEARVRAAFLTGQGRWRSCSPWRHKGASHFSPMPVF